MDEFFGFNGETVTVVLGNKIAIASDGKIVSVGTILLTPNASAVLLKSDGTPDPRFGNFGGLVVDFPIADLALQADGKIVIAGTTTVAGRTFFTVARYVTTGGTSLTPNQLFVAQVYADLLRRLPDTTGLASYSGLLDRGVSRTQVVQQIESSDEYHKLVVKDLYRRILGRFPDDSGNTSWSSFLNRGGTAKQMEAFLLGSDEYFKMAGGSNTSFLQAVYQLVLHRPIDSTGSQSWGKALAAGASRTAVAVAILASLEFDRLETQILFANWLHRSPDPSGLDTFTNLLQQGVSNETAIAIILSSDEYFAQI